MASYQCDSDEELRFKARELINDGQFANTVVDRLGINIEDLINELLTRWERSAAAERP